MGKSENILSLLEQRLRNGFYQAGSKFPSETLLADEFSVNKMTMNKVVSLLVNKGFLVRGIRGAGTRVAAGNIKASGSIVFLATLTPYAMQVLQGIYDEAVRHNFNVIIESPGRQDISRRLQLLRDSGIVSVAAIHFGIPLMPQGMRLCCIDTMPTATEMSDVAFVNSNNFQGGRKIMSEIIKRGHREILIFSTQRFAGLPDAPQIPRISGMHRVMEENGIADFEKRTFFSASCSDEDAKKFLTQHLAEYPKTTIIATDHDGNAALIHRAALELGIDCPGKIALTGFGNVSNLPIATVDQNPYHQGELAARRLINKELDGSLEFPAREEVDTKLVNSDCIPIKLG